MKLPGVEKSKVLQLIAEAATNCVAKYCYYLSSLAKSSTRTSCAHLPVWQLGLSEMMVVFPILWPAFQHSPYHYN